MSHVVILSEDKLFCEALADAVSRELRAEVTAVESPKTGAEMPSVQADLLVTTLSQPPRWGGRILRYPSGTSRKITSLLSDIENQLAGKPASQITLSEVIVLDEKARKLERTDTGSTRELTEKEQALLLFIKAQGEAVREDILSAVWGFAPDADTHTLETHIYRLRQKWRELADYDCIIATDRGYRWHE